MRQCHAGGENDSYQVNEQEVLVRGTTILEKVRERWKPGANVLIVNGFPCSHGTSRSEGDQAVLARRGEISGREELEILRVSRHTPGVYARGETARGGVATHAQANRVLRLVLGQEDNPPSPGAHRA